MFRPNNIHVLNKISSEVIFCTSIKQFLLDVRNSMHNLQNSKALLSQLGWSKWCFLLYKFWLKKTSFFKI